jgi:PAS domain S-box-containing protein
MSDAAERRLEAATSHLVRASASNDGDALPATQGNRLVQFFQSDAFLCERVGRFVADGLVEGDSAFALATPTHRRALCEYLRKSGFDVPRLQQTGRLALFDAREVLDSFMCDGEPDEHLFQSVLESLTAELVRDRPGVRIRAHGGLVDLLWTEGNKRGAIRVEELWNDAARSHSFTLMSSYALTAEERLRLFIECVNDYAIFMLDPYGYVVSWNVGARRIKGYSEQEIIGKHFSVFYPKEDAESGKCEHELAIAASEGRFEDEGWRIRKDGATFWANVVITAVHDRAGRLVGYGKVTRDLTARRAS